MHKDSSWSRRYDILSIFHVLIYLSMLRMHKTTSLIPDFNLASASLDPGTTGITISGRYDHFGRLVSEAGDVDGDGYDDVIIGATGINMIYVLSGYAFTIAHSDDLGDPWPSSFSRWRKFMIQLPIENNQFEWSASAAGDVNGDGYDDIILAAPGKNNKKGEAYVIYGRHYSSISDIELTQDTLNLGKGFKITGAAKGDYLGHSVSSAGDLNKDGYNDIIIGAYGKNRAYIIYGCVTSSRTHIDLGTTNLNPSITGFTISGRSDDFLGYSVSTAGDVNKDGYSDIIIGAYGKSSAYVIYGGETSSRIDIDLATITLNPVASGFVVEGSQGDYFGFSVSTAGDVNKDGYSDLIIGAYGKNKAYVIYGGSSASRTNLDLATTVLNPLVTGFTISGSSGDYLGYSVSSAGDVDKDGYSDIIVGAFGKNSVYVIYGGSISSRTNIDLATTVLNPSTTGFTITASSSLRLSVSKCGDVDKDGFYDIILGVYNQDNYDGQVQIRRGKNSQQQNIIFPSYSFGYPSFFSIYKFSIDLLGSSVSTAGDVNGDGYDDIIIGNLHNNFVSFGVVHVIYGSETGSLLNLDLATTPLDPAKTGFTIRGGLNDYLGYSVSTAGDINGDGYDDIIMGVHRRNNNQGAVYVVYGAKTSSLSNIDLTSTPLNPATTGFKITGSSGDSLGYLVSTAGDMNNDGYDDIIVTASQKESAKGVVYVIYGGETSSLSNINLATTPLSPASTGFTITGKDWSRLGCSASSLGDMNGDGYDDIIIGTEVLGEAYVIYGRMTSLTSNIELGFTTLDPIKTGFTIKTYGTLDLLSKAGDVNGDGFNDIIVGGFYSTGSSSMYFHVYVIYGGSVSTRLDIDLTAIFYFEPSLTWGFMIQGYINSVLNDLEDPFSPSVNTAGDINGDGYSDIIIGNINSGEVYVIYGGETATRLGIDLTSTPLDPQTGFVITNPPNTWSSNADVFGFSVSTAGDINGDGFDDIIISDPFEKRGSGAVYILHSACLSATSSTPCIPRQFCSTCKQGASLSNPRCKTCPSNCLQSSDLKSCLACEEGYYLSNSQCVLPIPPPETKTKTEASQMISSSAMVVGSILCVGNPSFSTMKLVSKIVQNIRYIDLSVTDELSEVFSNWGTHLISLDFPNVLSHLAQFKLLPSLFSQYNLESPFLVNIWSQMIITFIGLCALVLCNGLKLCFKRRRSQGRFNSVLQKLIIGSRNFTLVQIYGCLDEILFYFILDLMTNRFNTFFSWASFLFAFACVCVGVMLVCLNIWIVKRYQNIKKENIDALHSFHEKNKRWELFYTEFNASDSWGHSFLALLTIRSVLSASIIGTLYSCPGIQTACLVVIDGTIILFLRTKKPLLTLRATIAQYFCEIITLLVHICVFILSLKNDSERDSNTLKSILCKAIIYMNTAIVAGGSGFMLVEIYITYLPTIKRWKGFWKRRQQKRIQDIRVEPSRTLETSVTQNVVSATEPTNLLPTPLRLETNRKKHWINLKRGQAPRNLHLELSVSRENISTSSVMHHLKEPPNFMTNTAEANDNSMFQKENETQEDITNISIIEDQSRSQIFSRRRIKVERKTINNDL